MFHMWREYLFRLPRVGVLRIRKRRGRLSEVNFMINTLKLLAAFLVLTSCQQVIGPQGPPGPPGTNGTSVIPVQFCPGYTGQYPTTFPEFGLCIGGSLYGVYWDSFNSWLAEVYPGTYKSTSTTAPCDFTVGPNCQVTQ